MALKWEVHRLFSQQRQSYTSGFCGMRRPGWLITTLHLQNLKHEHGIAFCMRLFDSAPYMVAPAC